MQRRNFLALIAASLSGCAGVRQSAPPAAAILAPAAWRDGARTAATPLQRNWWQSFDDAVLNALVAEALAHSDDIAQAAIRVRAARAELGYAQAQRLPNVQAALGGGRTRSVNPGFGVPEEQSAGQALVQASFDIDLFGRLKAASASAGSALLATQYAGQTVQLSVAATVASTYFALLAFDARLAIVRTTLALRRNELHVSQRRFDEGYATALDLTRAMAEVEAAAQLVPTLELGMTQTENGLCILLGRAPGRVARGGTIDLHAVPEVPVALPAAMLRSRPDIAAAEARLAATDHALDVARAAFLPDIQLAASGGVVGSTLVDASPVRIWSLGTSILAPLFDAGRLQSQQDGATARRDAAAFAYRSTALQAFREVENNLAATARYREQYAMLARERDILARAFQLATRRYREGYANYLEQLDAQRSLLAVELSLVQARLDRFDASISLMQACGGGWTPDPAQQG